MEQETVIAGNKLIAEFMGWKFEYASNGKPNSAYDPNFKIDEKYPDNWVFGSWIRKDFEEQINEHLKYHTSWDWIIPAVKKFIDSHTIHESRDRNTHADYCNKLHNVVTDYNILPVFNVLSKAIKWYNTLPNNIK